MLNPVSAEIEAALRAELPCSAFRPLEPRYLEEPRGRFHGGDALLVTPSSVDEVAQVIRMAAAHRVGVLPYGGGTGLVGGQVAGDLPRPILLSLERMNRVRGTYPAENVLVVEAGTILADVQQVARDIDRMFPLSLASEGSAQIGGLLGVNAGGVNVLRYGNSRDLCLGLEAVLPDGSILRGLKRLRKDNTGYDLRNLLIGSEGTLGVITAASLRLYPRPAEKGAAFLVVDTPAAAVKLLAMAQRRMGDAVSAFELISGMGLEFLHRNMPDVRQPFAPRPSWMVLIGLGVTGSQTAEAEFEGLFEEAAEAGLVQDGVIAQNEAQRLAFWNLRESIPEANRRIGAVSSHDISVPISAIPEFIARGREVVAALGDFRINCFGHLGDGNLHYNVFPPDGAAASDFAAQRGAVTAALHDLVEEFEGSVSAEHGIGRLKVGDLERYGDPTKLAAMRAIKAALDPHGIMNPGAVLRMG
ncbi:FAD-binding oxidoreductase [Tropicimonas sediminicola]|uniref:FAD/FMN-containing dehydrogenase n=1 Tax=Tropicimonas sediminicola TaxID=1031541 RepID=A0A239KJ77_9RHOB|nr:FAD-binding oxidoreductase [Tropicimonas sediminicola]SNT17752.1 FAD/FMN-containing dehydrogenase [Tropicimonas sediminicola]